jgi:iron complex transport system ATP-binding protein
MSDAPLQASGLSVGYDGADVIDGLDLHVPRERITAVVGANGCGKSTLLRALARLLAPRAGSVLLDGREIRELPSREVARRLGVLPQAPVAPEGLTVAGLAARGRYPHQGLFRQWSPGDELAVEDALAATGMRELRDRPLDALSGGQRQRLSIARAIANEPAILLLDEIHEALDHEFRDHVERYARALLERGGIVIATGHDHHMLERFSSRALLLNHGVLEADGGFHDVQRHYLAGRRA